MGVRREKKEPDTTRRITYRWWGGFKVSYPSGSRRPTELEVRVDEDDGVLLEFGNGWERVERADLSKALSTLLGRDEVLIVDALGNGKVTIERAAFGGVRLKFGPWSNRAEVVVSRRALKRALKPPVTRYA